MIYRATMANQNRTTSYTNGHVAFFYATLAERTKLLAQYLKEGLAANELCVLSTPGSPGQTVDALHMAGLDAKDAYDRGDLRIVGMYQTYMPDGDFMPDTMLENVVGFIEDSAAKGYTGLRAAGEMRWINVYPDLQHQASLYETNVNGMCGIHRDFLGLCMYPLLDESIPILQSALRTHPAFIYDGHMRINPYAGDASTEELENVDSMPAFTSLLSCT